MALVRPVEKKTILKKIDMVHVNIIMLHVNINKSHFNIIIYA